MSAKPKIKVILGSIREGRLGDRVAWNAMEVLSGREDAEFELLDLVDFPMPLFDLATPPSMMDMPYENEVLAKWQQKIEEADGYIFITAEYNRGIPSSLKNAIDYLYKEWVRKPMAVISYGNIAGGTRAAEQLRTMSIELQMAPIRYGVHIPYIWEKFDDHGVITDTHFGPALKEQAEQLMWWTRALKAERAKVD